MQAVHTTSRSKVIFKCAFAGGFETLVVDNKVELTVKGTTSVSFEVTNVGDIVEIRAFGQSAKNRPTTAGRFTGTAYLVFKENTKIGHIDANQLPMRLDKGSLRYKIVLRDQEKNLLKICRY